MDRNFYTEHNRQAWDASAQYHLNTARWHALLANFKEPGFSTFDSTLTSILTALPIVDKRVVQIGCNNGQEILSAISLGAAEGLGIDQSADFLNQARQLNAAAGSQCDFIQADIYDLPETVTDRFEVALITIGVLGWMPDLGAFFDAVSSLLKRNGKLVIYETHPFLEMFLPDEPDPYKPSVSYFNKTPYCGDEAIVYDGGAAPSAAPWYWFNHPFCDILNGCIAAKLSIDAVHEYAHSNREVDYDLYANQAVQIPMSFSLVAAKR